jgi:hypothetical protein
MDLEGPIATHLRRAIAGVQRFRDSRYTKTRCSSGPIWWSSHELAKSFLSRIGSKRKTWQPSWRRC